MVGIGGTFEAVASLAKRAPVWAPKGALEWVFRLIPEPMRLFSRYFI